jgi:hypothetical protein
LVLVLVIGAYLIANRLVSVPNPTDNDWVGICVHALSVNEARIVNASGARWIRIDVFPEFEAAIKNAKAYGLSVLGILDSWMFNKNWIFTDEEWRGNVTHYVSQYADFVDAWEIWNEPAHPIYTLTAEKYYSMSQAASSIIRQHDPTAKIVLLGGLNLWSGPEPHLDLDEAFAEQLANMNISQYGDALSVHAYPWMGKVESWIWEKYTDSLAYYQELYPSLEIWVTETGHYVDSDGEEGQARYLHDALQYFSGKNVTKLFWYSLLDNDWEEHDFGLIHEDGTPRLAYDELRDMLD